MPQEWLVALSRRAAGAGLPVYLHAINREEYLAGASIRPRAIVHGCEDPLGGEELRALAASGSAVAPTLSLFASFHGVVEDPAALLRDPVLRASVPGFILDRLADPAYARDQERQFRDVARIDTRRWAREKWPVFVENTRRMRRAGVPVGAGTDGGGPVGYNFQGFNLPWELELLAGAGLTPLEAIAAATSVNARILGQDGRLGSVEAGKLADLIVVGADPTQDLRALRDIRLLMLGGRLLPRDALAWKSP
jgi:imidazolonepropionase-like amidohydrolase